MLYKFGYDRSNDHVIAVFAKCPMGPKFEEDLKMKRVLSLILAVLLLVSMLCACSGEAKETDGITITFTVTHDDGSEKKFDITTTATTLADALLQEKLVEESADSAGFYDVVDGEKASWDDGEAWWCFSKDGEALPVGIAETTIADGESYEAVFTHGFG